MSAGVLGLLVGLPWAVIAGYLALLLWSDLQDEPWPVQLMLPMAASAVLVACLLLAIAAFGALWRLGTAFNAWLFGL